MQNKIVCIVLFLFSGYSSGQNVIRIRSQHQKEHIYTLKKGEFFYRNESTFRFKLDGTDYEFKTADSLGFYKHTRKGKTKFDITSSYGSMPTEFKDWKVKQRGEYRMLVEKKTNKEYGPCQSIYFKFDDKAKAYKTDQSYRTESKLYGFRYSAPFHSSKQQKEVKKEVYIVRPGAPEMGPFKSGYIYRADEDEFIYQYENTEGYFLNENGTVYGPYEKLQYYPADKGNDANPSLLFYRQGDGWKAEHEKLKDYTFSRKPTHRGHYFSARITGKNDTEYLIWRNGKIREINRNQWLYSSVTGDELLLTPLYEAEYGYFAEYTVTYNDSLLGIYGYSGTGLRMFTTTTDFFSPAFIKVDSRPLPNGQKGDKDYYYFSPTKGFAGPFKAGDRDRIYFNKDKHFLFDVSDSSVTCSDGEKYDRIINFRLEGDDWWMIRSENDLHQPYKNGVPHYSTDYPSFFRNHKTPDKRFVIANRSDEYFIKPKGTKKLLGPIGKNSEVEISDDQKHFIESTRNGNIVSVDKRAISNGFNLVYNPKLNAFHWINVDDHNRIYLHTYELN